MDKFLGKRLDGRYEIQEIVGIGGMAVVYKAYDNIENKIVAVKILKEEYTGNDEFLRRFKNESKAIAVLSHPNIVKVFDVSFGDLIQYIVMEYIDGITLKEYIEKSGPLSWNEAVHFTLQILRGLQHAHDKGVVHRDIKPQNIMVLPDGIIKVADFGIARFARSDQETITDKAIGSVHYISPEQAKGEKTDEKADIYSVGVMLYEMLTGKLPFQAESAVSVAIMQLQKEPTLPRDINGSIPEGLEQITMHAMQKEGARRYKSAAEMLCDLESFKKNPAVTFDYDYFVDDSPTKFIPETLGDEKNSAKKSKKENKDGKSHIIPVLLGITATFVIALVLIIMFAVKFFTTGVDEIALPNFVGKTQEEVMADSEYKENFNFKVEQEYNSEYDAGYICSQTPEGGGSVKKGANVTLTVSLGEKRVSFPDVYGKSLIQAKAILEEAGFNVDAIKVEYEPSADIEAEHITRTTPLAKQDVPSDSEVTIYVSSGPPEDLVKLPSLINLSKEDVEGKLNYAGLELGDVTEEYSSTVPAGYVIKTSPDQSETPEVGRGTKVNIVVSKGPAPKISIPVNLVPYEEYDQVKISLWYDGEMIKGTEKDIDLSKETKHTFKNITLENPKIFEIYYEIPELGQVNVMRITVKDYQDIDGIKIGNVQVQ